MRCLPVRRAEGLSPRRIREVQFMLPEFVDRIGGSRWVSALPTGSKWVQAQPARRKQVGVGPADRSLPS